MHVIDVSFVALAVSLLAGCASNHDLKENGSNALGGGYREANPAPGIFYISSRTNFAPWVNVSGAQRSWRSRAEKLCGPTGYREVKISEGSYEQGPAFFFVPYIITTRDGYAVCNSAGLSDEEAMALISKGKN